MSEGQDGGIQGVMIDEVIDATQLPTGETALIVRAGGDPIGLVLSAENAQAAAELLAATVAPDRTS